MIQETRDWRTLLAHQYDNQPSTTPNHLGQSPASPSEIADVIHNPSVPSRRQLRREEKRQQGQL